ncbi:winged helix-turn-helix transcriptional regulator [Agromyces bracchium]|uniref:Transcriptional regulator n=1 Tax=Agromyces bracchium TaxID=88376 RepID=A0A6I3M537_9MICO|nr:helix-turn-helix domain-containing protein [Agromyces bracchium]MTH67212.1 transcriptional regulator [Agromyces bracchium]
MAARSPRGFGQYSGVARAIERVGERWAMLIVRDLLVGPRRYGDLKASLPRIPTNILADRLKELQEAGVVRRVPTVRGGYELTPFGRELEPVVVALERWGWSVLGDPGDEERLSHEALAIALRSAFRADAAADEPATEYVLHVGRASVAASVDGRTLEVVPIGPDAVPAPRPSAGVGSSAADAAGSSVEFALEPAELRDLIAGRTDASGVPVLAGDRDGVTRFARTFRIDPVEPPEDAAGGLAASVA